VVDIAKHALVTGAGGQDGSYISELLLSKGYEVFGTTRISINPNLQNLLEVIKNPNFHLLQADMTDSESLARAVRQSEPDEIYNLAAVSYMPASWDCPAHVINVNAVGPVRLLEATRNLCPHAKFYQASTSEMFGAVTESPQNELTPFRPVHPYGAAKLSAHWTAIAFREQYGLHVSCGILFNHESPRRGQQFVTAKVVRAAANISLGSTEKLSLWTLDSVRDWGFAGNYVEAMWRMLQREKAGDYVIGTGVGHSVRDLVECAFGYLNLDWRDWVVLNPPIGWSVDTRANYIADASRAEKELGWKPTVDFKQLIHMAVDADIKRLRGIR